MKDKIYDIAIIGGGPIGLNCGIEAEKHGLDYVILEKGCLVNSLYHYPLNMSFFSTSEKLEIGNVPFISHSNKPNRDEALEYYRRVSGHWKLNIKLYSAVENIKTQQDIFTLELKGKNKIYCRNVIIATGFFDIPNLMNVPGENLPNVHHYFKEAHPFSGQKVVVIGSANSAVDAALECYRKGSEVTMIVRQASISPRVKYWVKPDIENRIKEGSIRAFFGTEVMKIEHNHILIRNKEGQKEIQYNHIIAMTGYKPDFNLLKNAGINLDENCLKPSYNPETMESNISNIYLAGVICGGMETHKWFIENSRVHSEMILKNILKKLN